MDELEHIFDVLTPSEFKNLFGRSKSTRRYYCHSCVYEGTTKYVDAKRESCKTAFLESDGLSIHCIMCGEASPVVRKKCTIGSCKGDVISGDGEYAGACHSCGNAPAND